MPPWARSMACSATSTDPTSLHSNWIKAPMPSTHANLVIPVEVAGQPHQISATLRWPPLEEQPPAGVIVTVPGGTYDRSYWDLRVPEDGTYSFAEYATARGWIVLLMDNLGTGASS